VPEEKVDGKKDKKKTKATTKRIRKDKVGRPQTSPLFSLRLRFRSFFVIDPLSDISVGAPAKMGM
jgi:hypothetical protein